MPDKTTLERTAALLKRNRRKWVPAVALVKAGGLLAWRSRVSDCRTVLKMRVENKQERVNGALRSFYRYTGKAA